MCPDYGPAEPQYIPASIVCRYSLPFPPPNVCRELPPSRLCCTGGHAAAAPAPAAACQATLRLLQLVLGVLLPTLLAVLWCSPEEAMEHTESRATSMCAARRMMQSFQRAGTACDRALCALLLRPPATLALICWFLLSLAWYLSRRMAGLMLLV